MGQDFRALMGHSLSAADTMALPGRLANIAAEMPDAFARVGIPAPARWTWWWDPPGTTPEFEEWLRGQHREHGEATLAAGECLWISLMPRVLELGSWVRWRQFGQVPELQVPLRSIATRLAEIVGATAVYCMPDSGALEVEAAQDVAIDGGTIDDVARKLQEHGPPSATPESTTPRSYFVEHLTRRK